MDSAVSNAKKDNMANLTFSSSSSVISVLSDADADAVTTSNGAQMGKESRQLTMENGERFRQDYLPHLFH